MSDQEQRLAKQSFASPPAKSWSREQLFDIARKYMVREFGSPMEMDADERDAWYARLGILSHFVNELWDWRESV